MTPLKRVTLKGENMESHYFTQFVNERNLSKATVKQYRATLRQYCEFQGLSLDELINEADSEEEQGIRMKKRTLKTRLVNFRCYIIESDSKNTIINKMNQIKTFYRHFELEIPTLPYLSEKNIRKEKPIAFEDIPSKTLIRESLDFANQMMKGFILLQCSSGMGKAECLSLSVGQFISACDKMDENKSIHEMLIDIYSSKELIIPTFHLKRQKVNEFYYTFCTAEAVHEIVKYLLNESFNENRKLTLDAPLFKVSPNYVNTLMGQLNDVLGCGKVNGQYNKIRTHMFRKFNATSLCNGENALTEEEIDFLQGRSRGRIRETYLKKDPSALKLKYMKAMDNVLINHESSVVNVQRRELERNEEKIGNILNLIETFDVHTIRELQ